MLYGIGCDLCQVARMEKQLAGPHGGHFAARVFGPAERTALALVDAGGPALDADTPRGRRTAESAAANFAAKEAFLKAAGTGLHGFILAEIEALRRDSGAPVYAFSGGAQAWMTQNRLTAQLSLSHENGLALAFCTLEQGPATE